MRKAIFLDRDGVLNKELGTYTTHVNEFVVLDHAIKACLKLKEFGYFLVVITNQGGISKGLYSQGDLLEIHDHLTQCIPQIDAIFYCPHHNEKENCLCRKPKSLMIERAISKYGIHAAQSFMIGDSDRDVEAAKHVGVKAVKIKPNAFWDENIFKSIEG